MRRAKILLPVLLALLLCACAPAETLPPTAQPPTVQPQTAQPQTAPPTAQPHTASPAPGLRVAGAVWIPDGALVSARFSDYVTEEAALDLSQAELDEGAALLAAAPEAGEDAPRGGAFLGTRLRLEVRTEGGETCAAALDPVSDGRVNVTLARGGERETRVLVSADLAAWVQRVTGWKLASAEEIAAIERAETLEGQAVDPAIVEALRAHAAPENAVPSDGLSDPVYLRLELADGSTLRAAVDAACGDRFAIENQGYRAAADFYTYDIDAGALAPA